MKVFLDANVYFTGFYSNKGASSVVLELARLLKIDTYSSRLVLKEAERNLTLKASSSALQSFHKFLKETPIGIWPAPTSEELQPFESFIHPKDVPVLAAACLAQVDFLITLDRRHFMTPKLLKKIKSPKIVTPGEFLVKHWRPSET